MMDPKRLGAEDGELARLIANAEADGLDDDAIGRVKNGLESAGVLVVGSAGAGTASTGALQSLLGKTSSKFAIAAILGGVAFGGYRYAVHHRQSASSPQPGPAPVETNAPVAPLPEPITTQASPSEPRSVEQNAPPSRRAPSPSVALSASSEQPAPTPREGLLLLQARQSLTSDPQRTLDLVREHEQLFPRSQLVPERTKLRDQAILAGAK
jgi:hypothetical protein